MREAIKRAFDIGEKKPFKPNKNQKLIVKKISFEISKRHLTLPAIVTLETLRPLNYLGSQAMHFFQPIITSILNVEGYSEFTSMLEKRECIDYLIDSIKLENKNTDKKVNTEK